MEEKQVREIFGKIIDKARAHGEHRDYITDQELATYFPIMGMNAKRIRYYVNHGGLQAAGRVKRACVFGIKEVLLALEWRKNHTRMGV